MDNELVCNFRKCRKRLNGIAWVCIHNYHPQMKCGKVMFSEACAKNFGHGGGEVYTTLGRHLPRQTPPPPGTATAADGTHPTGMLSCYLFVITIVN